MRKNRFLFPSLITLFLLLALPFLVISAQTVQQLFIRAHGTEANITIDTQMQIEPIVPVWKSFAQGGEASTDMLAPVISRIKALTPTYIRLDHIFDHYNLVSRNSSGQLQYNFSQLDQSIKSIQATGALPFLSLSYMPSAIARGGEITGLPNDWNEWAAVVQRTVEHISGKNELNLTNVYYEVWNEPDLFGRWSYYGEKNYLTLYTYAAQAAAAAQNTNEFKFGGPATTQLYKNWIEALAKHATQNNLRLDFFSWHRYTPDPTKYNKDAADVTKWLFNYPSLVPLPRLITEWGFDPELNPGYDGNLAAAHAVASVRQALSGYTHIFAFEVVDGKNQSGNAYWGRWGLLTHPDTGALIKPRYQAFEMLNHLSGSRLLVSGEGTWVTAIASRNNDTITTLVSNFDIEAKHVEKTPITFTSLANGSYTMTQTRLGTTPSIRTISVIDNQFVTEIILPINSVILLELTPKSPITQ